MPVPQNAEAIWAFLVGQGFTDNAAAGILGNIEQESGGSPTAGSNPPGAGLIQILGDPGGSLQSELQKTMAYINANGSVADINAHASSPQAAALYFSEKYERPGIPDNANREQSAIDVLNAAKSGNWKAGSPGTAAASTGSSSSGIGGLISWPSEITSFFSDASGFVDKLMWLASPASWVRIGAFLAGVALLLFAIYALIRAGEGEPFIKAPSVIPVPV
jgi:Phage tail lysozyme